jgi:hypothetical protein
LWDGYKILVSTRIAVQVPPGFLERGLPHLLYSPTNMVSKTSMLPLVRAFDWKAVDAGLTEKPQLVTHRDERGRNWLHVCCATSLDGRDPTSSCRTADVLLAHGIDLLDHAFTEGTGAPRQCGTAWPLGGISAWRSTS